MAAVWDMDLPRDHKFVLLAYADHADHDGGSIYPAVNSIAKKTGYGARSVQAITRELEAAGRLVPDGKGPHGTRRWRMPLTVAGAESAPLQIGTQETHPDSPETNPAAPEPSVTIHEPTHMAPKNGRPRDELFDAIASTCQVDPATTGASIGKVKAKLLTAKPPYKPAEVEAFGKWWWGDKGMRQRPPTVWQLQEQIGVVRQKRPGQRMTDKEYGERLRAGTLPQEDEPFIPPSMRA
jgi:hypothetical protein